MSSSRDLHKRSSVLREYGLWIYAALMLAGVWMSPFQDIEVMCYAATITTLACYPMWRWLNTESQVLPAFEILMLTGVQFYGYPLLSGHGAVAAFSIDEIRPAAMAMIVFQTAAILTYIITAAATSVPKILLQRLIDDTSSKFVVYGLTSATLFTFIFRYTDLVPQELGSSLRALIYGINTVSIFIAMRRWGGGQLPTEQKVWTIANMAAQCILHARSLYLIEALSLNATAAVAYVSTSRRLPVGPIIAIVPIFFFLHAGKPAMRAIYWEGGMDSAYGQSLTDLPQFFSEWAGQSIEALQQKRETVNEGPSSLLDRASLFQMLCIVTNLSPNFVPFLEGESYASVVNQLVPRFLNPDKKSSVDSNRLLAIHYRISNEEESFKVSIAFGMIAEAFANFNYYGCALLGLFWGFLYKKATTAAVGSPSFSAIGIFMILLCAWALQAEMVMALWLVSLSQAAVCVIGLPLLWHWFNKSGSAEA